MDTDTAPTTARTSRKASSSRGSGATSRAGVKAAAFSNWKVLVKNMSKAEKIKALNLLVKQIH